MNILFVSAVMPYPLYSGGQVRIYNLLKQLSTRHTITLLAFIRDKREEQLVSHLSFCKTIIPVYRGRAWRPKYISAAILGKYPFLMATYDSALMHQTITTVLEQQHIDVLHIEPGYVFPSIPSDHPPLVIAEHNIEHTIYEEYVKKYTVPGLHLMLMKDVMKLKMWEKICWKTADAVVAVSKQDADTITQIRNTPVPVVSNGVDDTHFQFHAHTTISSAFRALFVGNFRWVQNQDAVKTLLTEVWPVIHTAFPQARLEIVGQHFPGSLRSHIQDGVEVNESVTDIREAFQRNQILLAPIHIGGGTKYKILEAMASGLIVLTTEKGKEGLSVEHKKHLFLCDHAEDYVSVIKKMIETPSLVRSVTHEARACVESQYAWKRIALTLEQVWKTVYEKHH